MKKIHEKIIVKFLYVIGITIVVFIIFSAGVVTGFHKASFGRAWGEHYEENFGFGNRGGWIDGIGKNGMMNNFPNAHGAIGKIIKIEIPTLIVRDKDSTEKVIYLTDDTEIQKMREEVEINDLKIDDFVIVIGSPNDKGQIEAKFIRIMPKPDLLNQIKTNETITQ